MPKLLEERAREALDVSSAFDNCFFHTYAAHLIANKMKFPDDLFNFKSILGDKSPASELQKRFPNADALSLFAEFSNCSKLQPLSPSFIVEKTLVLGFLLREWFATKMAGAADLRKALQEGTVKSCKNYKMFRLFPVEGHDLLSGPEGVFYAANKKFLEFFVIYPKDVPEELTPQQQKFKKYFTDHGDDADKALAAYWDDEGYQNYCQLIATPGTKLSPADVTHGLHILKQPVKIYYPGQLERPVVIADNEKTPKMEVLLKAQEGHYHLFKTEATETNEGTEKLLNEYDNSYKQYKKDRDFLGGEKYDPKVAELRPSLLALAICAPGAVGKDTFPFLLERVDAMKQFVVSEASRIKDAEKKRRALIAQVIPNIDGVLAQLEAKIGNANNHHFTGAYDATRSLLTKLNEARKTYSQSLEQLDTDEGKARELFINTCERAISQSRDMLARDLGWYDYLGNLFKSLLNAVLYVGSLGYSNSFFPYVIPVAVKAVDEAEESLSKVPAPSL